jgi:hypothetical protein
MGYYLKALRNLSMDYALLFQTFKENSRFYFTNFRCKNRYKHLIYKKETHDYLLFDELEERVRFLPHWSDDDALYSFVSPQLMNYFLNESLLDEENRRIYSSIREDDNPVIIKYTLK